MIIALVVRVFGQQSKGRLFEFESAAAIKKDKRLNSI